VPPLRHRHSDAGAGPTEFCPRYTGRGLAVRRQDGLPFPVPGVRRRRAASILTVPAVRWIPGWRPARSVDGSAGSPSTSIRRSRPLPLAKPPKRTGPSSRTWSDRKGTSAGKLFPFGRPRTTRARSSQRSDTSLPSADHESVPISFGKPQLARPGFARANGVHGHHRGARPDLASPKRHSPVPVHCHALIAGAVGHGRTVLAPQAARPGRSLGCVAPNAR
jgi:hypothetical protein